MNLDQYLDTVFIHEDALLRDIKADIVKRGMPSISVPPVTGAALSWLIGATNRKNILEIGVLGGYSGVWMARALPDNGRLTSLELLPEYRDVALANLTRAGLGGQVTYRVGPAADSLAQLEREGARFDFFFIDADKINYPVYLQYALKLAEPGAIIAADNTLQGGRVLDQNYQDASVEAIRTFNQAVADNPRLKGMLLPIGDGLTVAQVRS